MQNIKLLYLSHICLTRPDSAKFAIFFCKTKSRSHSFATKIGYWSPFVPEESLNGVENMMYMDFYCNQRQVCFRYHLFLLLAASILNGCGQYTRYARPELDICTDSLYRSAAVQADSATILQPMGQKRRCRQPD